MKKLIYQGNRELKLAEVPTPAVAEGEALLEVAVSAFCGSEKEDWAGEQGVQENPGHEFTGVVQGTGERVSVHVTSGCGKCYYCRIGMQQFCKDMQIIKGGHATHVIVPKKACMPIPEGMSHEEAVLLFGDTIGVGYRAVKRMTQDKKTPILVLGAGPIGLGALALLKHLGYRTVVFEISAYRRSYVEQKGLADWVVDSTAVDPKEFLAELTEGVGPATVIECTGNTAAAMQAVDLVRCGGTVILTGVNARTLDLSPNTFIFKELTVCGVWYQSDQDIEELTQLWREGFDPLPLISHRGTAEDAAELGQAFFEGKTAKAVIHWYE